LGIVTAGKCYYDVREALAQIGLDDEGLRRYGIRLLKLGMLYPLEPEIIKTFGRGLEEILVIEEKRAFVETFLRSILYDLSERPQVIGKKDETGQFLVKGYSELDADEIIQILAKRLTKRVPREPIEARLQVMKGPESPIILPMVSRTPYFCSGCPHNTSTVVPEGSLAGGGIGCHTLALLMDRNVTGVTQMGGEGVQWVGASPFSDMPHMFQNIGDGTLFHSGSMAIRQALTTNTNITYKILFNSAVAMTGGQQADGAMPIPELTRFLQAEGVRRTIVVAKDPLHFPVDAKWADNVEVWGREQLDEAQRILRDIPGVTTLIYDQECAADLRRRRKRGQADEPPMRVFINEAVCEGCGDCGVKSNCLSVFPVETEFGRKTQIHQSSCNKDYSCLNGDCPAFITLLPAETAPAESEESTIYQVERDLPEPAQKVPDDCQLYLMGIGGTGVVTVNQILGTAALLDGKHVRSLDQTGLSQKGGPVVSHLKILSKPSDVSNKISIGEADAYLVFDLLTGTTEANLSRARPDKTIAMAP
jgi:indolepyruvate ferredoxin oxidoreductase